MLSQIVDILIFCVGFLAGIMMPEVVIIAGIMCVMSGQTNHHVKLIMFGGMCGAVIHGAIKMAHMERSWGDKDEA